MEHIVKITKAPVLSGRRSTPDGAICGNGDLGIILGSIENGIRVYLSKCDLWQGIESHDRGGLKPLGAIDIPFTAPCAGYYVEQDMDRGELRCRFGEGKEKCEINLRPCKTENSVLLEISGNAGEPVLNVPWSDAAGKSGEIIRSGIKGIFRSFEGEDHVFETHAFAFMKKVSEGRYYLFAATNHDCPAPSDLALEKVRQIDEKRYSELLAGHYPAWQKLMAASSFTTEDEELEMGWYASQYFLAGCTGNKKFPPGLYANFVTVENPSWHSDYHLNYNYQAPFYAACSSNHVEFTDCYHAPLEEFAEKGHEFAKKWGCGGILYPVGIMPHGICSELTHGSKLWFERLFLGQKSNAIHPADIMVFRWRATRDKEYARLHAYPYIKACLEFFEDWMVFEDGRYSVCRDAAHEVPYYRDDFEPARYRKYINGKNNALTLGMLRLCLPAAIEMAEALGIDEEKRIKWNDILEKLSGFPTYYRYFRKIFRMTETGQSWNDGNDVGLQHIYPGGCVGKLKSDEDTFRTAVNTFRQKEASCWTDENAANSFFPMAARLGIDPDVITKKLHEMNSKKLLPNMLYDFAGGCLENCPIFAATLNEMVLQSFEGTVRIFPCWNKNKAVEFKNLRADGAFLVSAAADGGETRYVEITSEAGEKLSIENPFPVSKFITGSGEFITDEKFITLNTEKGEKIRITAAK